MGALVGNEPARDDIALLMMRRRADRTDTTAVAVPPASEEVDTNV
jgi:hypothetical protein